MSLGDRFRSAGEGTRQRMREPRWWASVAAAAAIALYVLLPEQLVIGPRWLVPVLEGGLLVSLLAVSPYRHGNEPKVARWLSIGQCALVSLANTVALLLLLRFLLQGGKATGVQLIFSAIQIWLTNVLVFGLWYWELDAGGPGQRINEFPKGAEFLFPQMTAHELGANWLPSFVDYLYVSFTNSTAFSPTDTMPLSVEAKLLMAGQALVALITVALVAARAVNILA
jgi:hypothetical protein